MCCLLTMRYAGSLSDAQAETSCVFLNWISFFNDQLNREDLFYFKKMAKPQELSMAEWQTNAEDAARVDLFLLPKWKDGPLMLSHQPATCSVHGGGGQDPGFQWVPVKDHVPRTTPPYSEIVARNLHFIRKYFLQVSEGERFSGLVPLGNWGPDLTDAPRHRNCEYCICTCVGKDSFCNHCCYYMGSTPSRCYGELKIRCGSIAYLLRHRFHREGRVDTGLILRVASAFKKTPMLVSSDGEPQPPTSAILAKMTPRQRWTYQIMTGTHELGDQVYHQCHAHLWPESQVDQICHKFLTSIYDAADGYAVWRQIEKKVPFSEFESDVYKNAIKMWLESCVDPFVAEI